MSKLSQVLVASVVLVLAILLAEQSLHLLFHALCWGANILSGLRMVAFSLPEVFSPPGQQQISSVEFDQFVRRVEEEMVRLHNELDRMKDREKSEAHVEIKTGGEVEDKTTSTRIEDRMEELRLMFHEKRDATESIRSENLSKLMETIDSLASRLTELESSNVTALESERNVAAIRQEVKDWSEKTYLDSSSVQAQLQDVFEKYSRLSSVEILH